MFHVQHHVLESASRPRCDRRGLPHIVNVVRRTRRMANPQGNTKRCSKCGETKPATPEHFSRKASSRDGLYPWCKPCKMSYSAARQPDYYAANQAEDNARSAAYYSSHREEIAVKRASAQGHAIAKKTRSKHPDRGRARQAVAYAIKAGRLVIQPCSSCELAPKKVNGQQRIEAHHHLGYSEEHWLDIVWLCQRCHGKAETSERRTGRAETEPPEPSRQESRPAMEHPEAEDELEQMSLW